MVLFGFLCVVCVKTDMFGARSSLKNLYLRKYSSEVCPFQGQTPVEPNPKSFSQIPVFQKELLPILGHIIPFVRSPLQFLGSTESELLRVPILKLKVPGRELCITSNPDIIHSLFLSPGNGIKSNIISDHCARLVQSKL